jgi:hypothetical protein
VPRMNTSQINKVSELYRPKFPYCETCNSRAVVRDLYIKTFNGSARLVLVCPNHAKPHPEGHDLADLTLEPDAARSLGL